MNSLLWSWRPGGQLRGEKAGFSQSLQMDALSTEKTWPWSCEEFVGFCSLTKQDAAPITEAILSAGDEGSGVWLAQSTGQWVGMRTTTLKRASTIPTLAKPRTRTCGGQWPIDVLFSGSLQCSPLCAHRNRIRNIMKVQQGWQTTTHIYRDIWHNCNSCLYTQRSRLPSAADETVTEYQPYDARQRAQRGGPGQEKARL